MTDGTVEFSNNRSAANSTSGVSTGPFLARVIRVVDPEYMGRIEVQILHVSGSGDLVPGELTFCEYMSPFYGVTSARYLTPNQTYDDTQKSYGMWVPTPDIGTKVIVLYVEGLPNKAFWIGCVPDTQKNFMVPGYAATSYNSEANGKDVRLPVAEPNQEFNQRSNIPATSIEKAPHKYITQVLVDQGLVNDDVRGITSSSARRETPSRVFGISTPGPVDKTGPSGPIGTIKDLVSNAAVSRLGGSSFVMDDGDEKFIRKTKASDGPPVYTDVLGTKSLDGERTIPHNELVRLRTRTGHQILLHNSEDLIYIGNAKGTTWIELTSSGKIDIYAKDSVSIHTENDLNIRADRDINLEAGRNFNVSAKGKVHVESQAGSEYVSNATTKITSTGASHINSGGNHIETAPEIHMNGPVAEKALILPTFAVPDYSTKKGKATLQTIMKRVPCVEPWPHHENLDPAYFNPANTDSANTSPISKIPDAYNNYTITADTFKQGR